MTPSRIVLDEHFEAYALQLHAATRRAVAEAGAIALEATRQVSSEYRIQAIVDAVELSGVEETSKGAGIWIIARDWRSLFFEKGTYTRRKGKLKQPRRSTRANIGVKAQFFLRHGARAGQAALLPALERAYARIHV